MDLNPRLFNRQLIHTARGVNVKAPWLFTNARHVEGGHYWAWKPRSATFTRSRTKPVTTGTLENLEKNPPCNAKDNLRAGLIVFEAWFRGY